MKKNLKSVVFALMVAVPLSMYAGGQNELNVQAHKDNLKPVSLSHKIMRKEVAKEEPEYIALGEFKLTAYCSCVKCCGDWAKDRPVDEEGNEVVIGASGEVLEAGVSIAVDQNVIPYGATVLINGQPYIAHDCGGAIKQNEIDVYFDDHQEAKEFGVQYAEVFLLKEGEK